MEATPAIVRPKRGKAMQYRVSPHVAILLQIFGEREIDLPGLEEAIEESLSTLKPFEQQCLRLKFGLPRGLEINCAELNYAQIARELDTTPTRVSRHVRKAMRRLRHPSRSRKLLSFIKQCTTN